MGRLLVLRLFLGSAGLGAGVLLDREFVPNSDGLVSDGFAISGTGLWVGSGMVLVGSGMVLVGSGMVLVGSGMVLVGSGMVLVGSGMVLVGSGMVLVGSGMVLVGSGALLSPGLGSSGILVSVGLGTSGTLVSVVLVGMSGARLAVLLAPRTAGTFFAAATGGLDESSNGSLSNPIKLLVDVGDIGLGGTRGRLMIASGVPTVGIGATSEVEIGLSIEDPFGIVTRLETSTGAMVGVEGGRGRRGPGSRLGSRPATRTGTGRNPRPALGGLRPDMKKSNASIFPNPI